MKNLSFLIFIIFIFSCADIKENTVTTVFKKCDCEKTIKTDSVFYATNVTLKKDIKQKMIVFNCATIEIAIASVSDVNGNNEHCENLYDIKCTSNSKEQLKLNRNFTYFSENKQNMDVTKEGS